jgi:cyclase
MNKLMGSVLACMLLAATSTWAQDFDKVQIEATKVTDGIYMLTGAGGNITVSIGKDGIVVIDDQYAPLADKIMTAIGKLSDDQIEFVINTHWHGDHTGGNEQMAESGAVIVAHDNVLHRMSTDQVVFGNKVPASSAKALPVVTFTRDLSFHLNDHQLDVVHMPAGHTDGDAIIHFREANVIVAGDLFVSGFFPFIDSGTGGSVQGMLAATDRILAMSNNDTRIVPGHGPLSNKQDLAAFRKMLAITSAAVDELVTGGKTIDQAVAADPTHAYNEKWGNGFLNAEKYVRVLYGALIKR